MNTALEKYVQMNPDVVGTLGERLYYKIKEFVIPEWQEAFNNLTREDCIAYISNLTINRTFDGYIREKSVVYDGLVKFFPHIFFDETYNALDKAGTDFSKDIGYLIDVDYLGYVGEKAFGLQIKPTTAATDRSDNYPVSERMRASFSEFQDDFTGKVFIVFSLDGEIGNPDIIAEIADEIIRLQQ